MTTPEELKDIQVNKNSKGLEPAIDIMISSTTIVELPNIIGVPILAKEEYAIG